MAARNADSMTNAQGEFHPRQPRAEPMEKHGHQMGQKTSPNDYAPEFSAKTLPPGTAPKESTFQPNATSEIPGQQFNDNVDRSHGKEGVRTDPLSTLPGATSADVHTGLGHPGQGQTSTELRHEGHHTASKATSGPEGAGATGGSGLHNPDDLNREFRRLQDDSTHPTGPIKEHNQTLAGAEEKEPMSAEFVASEGGKAGEYAKGSGSRNATTGASNRGAAAPRE
ncbi:hypothetical protein G647_09723 [Cladophialophora carrionii CBS 160.54]|uniref:Uncharacterized protein n=1 Tax=Cladophialophora carrionii CBS 160.54 TaxID=1279043 RepID=V9DNJ2_9EURO|nr:uncharacterized protein G647_09723 [Cladophialophora carrionii CBS 160.54]ETI27532.1 hypothetical protein G647_09723 [Cladophialophora carrionii CBS 160.54]